MKKILRKLHERADPFTYDEMKQGPLLHLEENVLAARLQAMSDEELLKWHQRHTRNQDFQRLASDEWLRRGKRVFYLGGGKMQVESLELSEVAAPKTVGDFAETIKQDVLTHVHKKTSNVNASAIFLQAWQEEVEPNIKGMVNSSQKEDLRTLLRLLPQALTTPFSDWTMPEYPVKFIFSGANKGARKLAQAAGLTVDTKAGEAKETKPHVGSKHNQRRIIGESEELNEADRKSVGAAILGKSYTLNVGAISPKEAIAFAKKSFSEAGLDLYELIPDFDKNFALLKKSMGYAKDIPRVMMPVIEPADLTQFRKDLKAGAVDIFKPWAKGKLGNGKFPWYPELKGGEDGKEWVTLGFKDGSEEDDVLRTKPSMVPVKGLKPLQGEIWFDKLIGSLLKFGLPEPGGFLLTNAVIIVSKEGYILDGHHRFGQAMLTDPNLQIKALKVPLGIELLLKVGRSYGSAIGNVPKE